MSNKVEISFEEAFEKLQAVSENFEKENISLADALKNYEEGIDYYNKCNEILNTAKQKIETIKK